MMLSQLLEQDLDVDMPVVGLCDDSREVRHGDVFCALSGLNNDGFSYADDAVAQGAVAVLCEEQAAGHELPVPVVASTISRSVSRSG